MNQDFPSMTHNSCWGALWLIEIYPVITKLDDSQLILLFAQYLSLKSEETLSVLNLLQNGSRFLLGTQEEKTARGFAEQLNSMNIQCFIKELSPDSPERWPRYLAPDDYFEPQPWELMLTACGSNVDIESATRCIVEQLQLSTTAANELIQKCRLGASPTVTIADLEQACTLAESLRSCDLIAEVK